MNLQIVVNSLQNALRLIESDGLESGIKVDPGVSLNFLFLASDGLGLNGCKEVGDRFLY